MCPTLHTAQLSPPPSISKVSQSHLDFFLFPWSHNTEQSLFMHLVYNRDVEADRNGARLQTKHLSESEFYGEPSKNRWCYYSVDITLCK